jgi:hypothetical protein
MNSSECDQVFERCREPVRGFRERRIDCGSDRNCSSDCDQAATHCSERDTQ